MDSFLDIDKLVATVPLLSKVGIRKFCLVQYSKNSQDLVHAIVRGYKVFWQVNTTLTDGRPPTSDIIIRDGQKMTSAKLLLTHDSRHVIDEEFSKLKYWCYQKGFDESDLALEVGHRTWFFVFYTLKKSKAVHTIVNNIETVRLIGVDYDDFNCYLKLGTYVYQAMIVRKSEDFEDCLEAMTTVRNSITGLQFPIVLTEDHTAEHAMPPPDFQSLVGISESESSDED